VIDDLDLLHPADRSGWRQWLETHHDSARGCWVVLPKRGGVGVAYAEAVEEALCFGWIDGRTRPQDDLYRRQHFAPRKKGGNWARSNKERVERLEAAGLMTNAGRAVIEAAKADGSWNALDDVEALVVPDDLAAALATNPQAQSTFEAFAPSTKQLYLWWVKSAKRPETRAARITDTVWLVERGIKQPRRVAQ
jgi:uncharacterized protein YdeI (YjbR/CyaY-like superfamily)